MKDPSTKGVALINSLIVVAAVSAISVALLVRVDNATQRIGLNYNLAQTDLYLDATEHLVRITLDRHDSELVHFGQEWARERSDEPISQGSVSWQIKDLQGRFNVNQMIGDEIGARRSRAAFFRLLQAEGFSEDRVTLFMDAFSSVEERRNALFGLSSRSSRPPALPLQNLRELASLGERVDADVARLSQVAAALPQEASLNVNTIDANVLAAFLPELSSAFQAELKQRQEVAPFQDANEFLEWSKKFLEGGEIYLNSMPALSTSSEWFEAVISADLGSTSRKRTLLLHRPIGGTHTIVTFSTLEVVR